MLESLNFTYNGKSSSDMGVINVHEGSGLFKDLFLPTRKINVTRIKGKDKSYFKGVDTEPLSFPLTIFIEEWRDRNNLRKISEWLFQEYFKPLTFESHPERIFYAIVEGSSSLLHNGCQDGYVTLNVVCNSPFTYSPLIPHELSIQGVYSQIFYNEGDRPIRPQLKITKIGDGDISIKNESNQQILTLKNLYNNEIVYINGEHEEIMSSLQRSNNRYLHDNHNDVWLDFEEDSSSKFTFTGNFNCEFYMEYIYLNEDRPIHYA